MCTHTYIMLYIIFFIIIFCYINLKNIQTNAAITEKSNYRMIRCVDPSWPLKVQKKKKKRIGHMKVQVQLALSNSPTSKILSEVCIMAQSH